MALDRRALLLGLAGLCAAGRARAAGRTRAAGLDEAGRPLPAPSGPVTRVFPAGPPAAILLYTLAPDLLAGWPRAIRPAERPYLLPEAAALPEVGRLTGRGNTANLETVLALKPDLVVDTGDTGETYRSLADRLQQQTGIPALLFDGRLPAVPATYRRLGAVIGRAERAERLAARCEAILNTVQGRLAAVPPEARPRVYFARGPRGLETARAGAINVEVLDLLGAVNVAGAGGSLARVSPEDVLAWAPEVIVALDPGFAAAARTDPLWQGVPAVAAGRLHLSPALPFGWVDSPPSVNRFLGLWWLGKALYPSLFPEDLRALARDFHRDFYHVVPDEAALDRLLAGAS
ncbi:periplasmic binding protein [Methylobacterium sp. 4-46]|uniref:iron ABC transporter substrate-binding protein n=1 Tax=unclassified Methylobacterium TaxID=2615210 RepID=UPI000165C76D|nr:MULTISPECIES: iron ABC transporter substrate-binding protein [Methylobacterium]ACA14986.1 periplasmic binding protein [Methylobacterium sp. 4-46]WFT80723.1 iron ABC transporter substrate-binding protein [Methylobacterium nodulans]